jgi:hypothetical protein
VASLAGGASVDDGLELLGAPSVGPGVVGSEEGAVGAGAAVVVGSSATARLPSGLTTSIAAATSISVEARRAPDRCRPRRVPTNVPVSRINAVRPPVLVA